MNYQLLDTGNGYKVEKFNNITLLRPEPQAFWILNKSLEYWKSNSDAFFLRNNKGVLTNKEESGEWVKNKSLENWIIEIGEFSNFRLKAKLSLSSFKHIGIFPEQYSNWKFIETYLLNASKEYHVLNLFAYTGIASIVAASCGFKVTHVDSVKQVVSWANENKTLSKVPNTISWVVEDAVKFVKREVNRNKKYKLIILDPPAYGRGANGEKWLLEKDIFELLINCKKILLPKDSMLLISLYSMNITPVLLKNILMEVDLWSDKSEVFEQCINYREKFSLPFGITARCIF